MRRIIDFKTAILTIIIILGILALFHTVILACMLFFDYAPMEFLWGGRIKSEAEFFLFEVASLVSTAIFILLVFIRSRRLNIPRLSGIARVAMWLLSVFFLFNTIGNLLGSTTFERMFALVSGALALLFLRIAIEKKDSKV